MAESTSDKMEEFFVRLNPHGRYIESVFLSFYLVITTIVELTTFVMRAVLAIKRYKLCEESPWVGINLYVCTFIHAAEEVTHELL